MNHAHDLTQDPVAAAEADYQRAQENLEAWLQGPFLDAVAEAMSHRFAADFFNAKTGAE